MSERKKHEERKPIEKEIMQVGVYGSDPEGNERDDAMFFVYSVGMEKFERPDLLIREVPQWLLVPAMRALNEWCDYFRRGPLPTLGDTLGDPKGKWPYVMRMVEAPKNYRGNRYGLWELQPVLVPTCHAHEEESPDGKKS